MIRAQVNGNVGKDPEVRTTTNGTKVATYSVASSRPNPQDKEKPLTDWVNVVAWGDQADLVMENLKKGTKVTIGCKIQTRSYQDKDGKTVYTTDYIQEVLGIVPTKKKNDTGSIHGDDSLPF